MSDTNVIDLEVADRPSDGAPKPKGPEPSLYRVYEGSRIAVSNAVGPMFKKKLDAAILAYEHVNTIWELCFKYYNHDQTRTVQTPRGLFRRGDATENIVFSNLNVMLPAVYSKDPDITCTTSDEKDQPFCNAIQALINALFRRKDGLNAKYKVKKAAGMALLTNFGIFKLLFTQKSDSREFALTEMERITMELATANKDRVEELYGELDALEQNMEVLVPSGFSLSNVLPHNLIIDPYAEQPDGLDATWQMERVFILTASLTARFTKPSGDDPEDDRVLIYKPTHKAQFAKGGDGRRDDGLGMVMQAIDGGGDSPTSHTEDERSAYLNMYYTECFYVWDKATKRLMLFHRDDWKWPIWVWDDPMKTTRFFPYYIISFVMSTGGTVSAGETAYILDHQDEINDINRQKNKIRRSIFDYFFYDSDTTNTDEVEKLITSLRGEGAGAKHVVGIRAGGKKLSDMVMAVPPPSAEHFDKYFDIKPVLDSINRITNTNDALRGVQFKTNTNVAAVKSYEESLRLSVGSKVDVVEDTVADLAVSIAEICVQNYDQTIVAGYVGDALAVGWEQMDLDTFRATYSLTLVSGSMEKPNSVFKKKEAIEVSQAVGQFAQAAPGAAMRIMLRVLSQAFTEIVIKPEDWAAIDQEIQANLTKGVSQPGAGGQGAPPNGGGQPGQDVEQLRQQAMNLPPEVKAQVVKMHQQGASNEQISQFVMQQVQQHGQQQQQQPRSIGGPHGPA